MTVVTRGLAALQYRTLSSDSHVNVSITAAGDQSPDPLDSPRVPKLLVRNRFDIDDIHPVGSSPTSTAEISRVNTSDDRPSHDRHLTSSHGASSPLYHSPSLHDNSPMPTTKDEKRKRGILGFFTLKEPSTSAWEEFAQQQRAENSQKGAKPSGFSTQKLPETVPKVNSKWDGLPTGARERSTTSASLKRSMEMSSPGSKRSEHGKDWESSNSSQLGQARRDRSLNSRSTHKKQFSDNTAITDSRPATQHTISDANVRSRPSASQEASPKTNQDENLTGFSSVPDIALSFPGSNSSGTPARPTLKSGPLDPVLPTSQPRSTSNAESLANGADFSYISAFLKRPAAVGAQAEVVDVSTSKTQLQRPNGVNEASMVKPFRTSPQMPVAPAEAPTVELPQKHPQINGLPAEAPTAPSSLKQPQSGETLAEAPAVQPVRKQISSRDAQSEITSVQPFGKQPQPDDAPAAPAGVPSIQPYEKKSQVSDAPVVKPAFQMFRRQQPKNKAVIKPTSSPSLDTTEPDMDGPAEAPDVPVFRRRPQDTGSEPSADSSPYAPLTPEDPTTMSPATDPDMQPAMRHTRKRSNEDTPQWPLPLTGSDSFGPPPPVPPKSARRSSASSQDEQQSYLTTTDSESDDDKKTQLDGPFVSPPRQISKPTTVRSPIRSFSRPLQLAPTSRSSAAVPMGTISIVRNQQTYAPSNLLRAPPAFQPGRVITKDSDLATIPESDTVSVRTLSVHMAPTNNNITTNYTDTNADHSLRTTMDFSDTDTDDDDDDGYGDGDTDVDADDLDWQMRQDVQQTSAGASEPPYHSRGPSLPESRASSELSDDWHKTPRERLGLGGVIRRKTPTGTSWSADGVGGSEDDAAVPPSVPAAGEATNGTPKKGTLRGVFKRS